MNDGKKFLALVMATVILIMGGCATSKPTQETVFYNNNYGEKITLSAGRNAMLQNDRLTVYLDSETFGVILVDRLTGMEWSSNPADAADDAIANLDTKKQMCAQFKLSYYDASGNLSHMNSYTDSVEKAQTTVHAVEDGFEVHYQLGEYKITIKDVPSKLSTERFQLFVEKLKPEGQETLKKYYKLYESERLWSMTSSGRNHAAEIHALLQEAGYTPDDLNRDNAEFGISSKASVKPTFDISLRYTLNEDGFSVSVPTDRIQYNEEYYSLYDLELMEFFGAVKNGKTGYLFVPDGSGALIEYDEGNSSREMYSMPVYGDDDGIRKVNTDYEARQIRMPVFGIKADETACVGIITEGEAGAFIKAYRAGRNHTYNCVYPAFRIAGKDMISIGDRGVSTSTPSFEKRSYKGSYTVRYCLLQEEDANYSGMARRYRQYLLDNGILTKSDTDRGRPLFVETVGGVTGYKEFLNFSYTGLKAVTTYEENIKILEDLKGRGVEDISLKLSAWFNGGYLHTYPEKIKLESVLGGKKGFEKLSEYCAQNAVALYPDANMLTAKKGNGFRPVDDAVRALDRKEIIVQDFLSPATKLDTKGFGIKTYESYLVSPNALSALFDRYLSACKSQPIQALSFHNIGTLLYSDFREEAMVNRVLVQKEIEAQLQKSQDSGYALMVGGGNQYAVQYADAVMGAPNDYSYYDFESCAVPFYQMVYGGYVQLAGDPLNLSTDAEMDFLRAIEGGTSISFQVIYRDPSLLKNTEYSANFAPGYADWASYMAECYDGVQHLYSKTKDSPIYSHETVQDGVVCTTYENGTKVYVNYTEQPATVESVQVDARSFTVIG